MSKTVEKKMESAHAHKESISELRKVKNHLEAILDGIDEGLAVIDRNYRIRNTNRAFFKSLRYAGESVVGKYCYKVLHNYAKPCKQCIVRNTFQTGKSLESIHSHRDSDGTKIYHETRAYPKIEKKSFQTALIDIKMPGVNGKGLVSKIKRTNPRVPIVIITGSPDFKEEMSLKKQVYEYIYKPLRLNELMGVVKGALRQT